MTCCLTAPSHYLNQCWLNICQVLWHYLREISQEIFRISIPDIILKITNTRLWPHLPGANEFWTFGNKLQWNLNWNLYIFIQENAFDLVVRKSVAILSPSQCVKIFNKEHSNPYDLHWKYGFYDMQASLWKSEHYVLYLTTLCLHCKMNFKENKKKTMI